LEHVVVADLASGKPSNRGISIAKGRFEAFSDGVFAIAITLLILEFRTPELTRVNDATMTAALLALSHQYLVYFASFATIGIMWFNHYALFHNVPHVSYAGLIANLALLMFVAFLPFPTLLLGRYGLLTASVVYFGLTLLAIAICFNVLWYVATLGHEQRGSIAGFLRSRTAWNTVGFIVYALGTVLALVSPTAAVALFACVAVYYMLPSSVRSTLEATASVHESDFHDVAG
jgi:TMEM175 potassium channel family protein